MNENKARSRLDQRRAPIYEALERFRQMRVGPFDVPGHKRGRGNLFWVSSAWAWT